MIRAIIGFLAVVAGTSIYIVTHISFFLFFSIAATALLVYLIIRAFKNQPVLILSTEGLESFMSITAKEKIGLIPWREIINVRSIKSFGFIKAINIYCTPEFIATKDIHHQSKNSKFRDRFVIQLSNDELKMTHEELYSLLIKEWNKYK